MFQSPMMMIMVLTGGMMLAMPYIMVSSTCICLVVIFMLVAEKLGPRGTRNTERTSGKGFKYSRPLAKWRSQRVSDR
jgi:cellobiose-specific phosphotransferase system component IIC